MNYVFWVVVFILIVLIGICVYIWCKSKKQGGALNTDITQIINDDKNGVDYQVKFETLTKLKSYGIFTIEEDDKYMAIFNTINNDNAIAMTNVKDFYDDINVYDGTQLNLLYGIDILFAHANHVILNFYNKDDKNFYTKFLKKWYDVKNIGILKVDNQFRVNNNYEKSTDASDNITVFGKFGNLTLNSDMIISFNKKLKIKKFNEEKITYENQKTQTEAELLNLEHEKTIQDGIVSSAQRTVDKAKKDIEIAEAVYQKEIADYIPTIGAGEKYNRLLRWTKSVEYTGGAKGKKTSTSVGTSSGTAPAAAAPAAAAPAVIAPAVAAAPTATAPAAAPAVIAPVVAAAAPAVAAAPTAAAAAPAAAAPAAAAPVVAAAPTAAAAAPAVAALTARTNAEKATALAKKQSEIDRIDMGTKQKNLDDETQKLAEIKNKIVTKQNEIDAIKKLITPITNELRLLTFDIDLIINNFISNIKIITNNIIKWHIFILNFDKSLLFNHDTSEYPKFIITYKIEINSPPISYYSKYKNSKKKIEYYNDSPIISYNLNKQFCLDTIIEIANKYSKIIDSVNADVKIDVAKKFISLNTNVLFAPTKINMLLYLEAIDKIKSNTTYNKISEDIRQYNIIRETDIYLQMSDPDTATTGDIIYKEKTTNTNVNISDFIKKVFNPTLVFIAENDITNFHVHYCQAIKLIFTDIFNKEQMNVKILYTKLKNILLICLRNKIRKTIKYDSIFYVLDNGWPYLEKDVKVKSKTISTKYKLNDTYDWCVSNDLSYDDVFTIEDNIKNNLNSGNIDKTKDYVYNTKNIRLITYYNSYYLSNNFVELNNIKYENDTFTSTRPKSTIPAEYTKFITKLNEINKEYNNQNIKLFDKYYKIIEDKIDNNIVIIKDISNYHFNDEILYSDIGQFLKELNKIINVFIQKNKIQINQDYIDNCGFGLYLDITINGNIKQEYMTTKLSKFVNNEKNIEKLIIIFNQYYFDFYKIAKNITKYKQNIDNTLILFENFKTDLSTYKNDHSKSEKLLSCYLIDCLDSKDNTIENDKNKEIEKIINIIETKKISNMIRTDLTINVIIDIFEINKLIIYTPNEINKGHQEYDNNLDSHLNKFIKLGLQSRNLLFTNFFYPLLGVQILDAVKGNYAKLFKDKIDTDFLANNAINIDILSQETIDYYTNWSPETVGNTKADLKTSIIDNDISNLKEIIDETIEHHMDIIKNEDTSILNNNNFKNVFTCNNVNDMKALNYNDTKNNNDLFDQVKWFIDVELIDDKNFNDAITLLPEFFKYKQCIYKLANSINNYKQLILTDYQNIFDNNHNVITELNTWYDKDYTKDAPIDCTDIKTYISNNNNEYSKNALDCKLIPNILMFEQYDANNIYTTECACTYLDFVNILTAPLPNLPNLRKLFNICKSVYELKLKKIKFEDMKKDDLKKITDLKSKIEKQIISSGYSLGHGHQIDIFIGQIKNEYDEILNSDNKYSMLKSTPITSTPSEYNIMNYSSNILSQYDSTIKNIESNLDNAIAQERAADNIKFQDRDDYMMSSKISKNIQDKFQQETSTDCVIVPDDSKQITFISSDVLYGDDKIQKSTEPVRESVREAVWDKIEKISNDESYKDISNVFITWDNASLGQDFTVYANSHSLDLSKTIYVMEIVDQGKGNKEVLDAQMHVDIANALQKTTEQALKIPVLASDEKTVKERKSEISKKRACRIYKLLPNGTKEIIAWVNTENIRL